jgi:hypothetical protein
MWLRSSRTNGPNYLAPEAISALCAKEGLSWRERLLPPATTVQLMLLQVLHSNTAISHLPHLAKMRFCPSSFCRARAKLPVSLFEQLLERIIAGLQKDDFDLGTWLGHRVFIADGTGVSMPDTPAHAERFGYPTNQKDGVGFPVTKLSFMIHLGTGMISKLLIKPLRSHEMQRIDELHLALQPNDIFLADRAYCSYHHFCLLLKRKAQAVIRMHYKLNFDTSENNKRWRKGQPHNTKLRVISKTDRVIEWFKPLTINALCAEQYHLLSNSIAIREITYCVAEKGFRTRKIRLLTTLIDENKYPAEKIAELYQLRWQIETGFNHLKTTINMNILKSKTPDGVVKELLCYCIIYNLIRAVMSKAAEQQGMQIERISFVDALRWLIHACPEQKLSILITNPYRPGRFEPRTRKRRPKAGYKYAKEHRRIQKLQLLQGIAA